MKKKISYKWLIIIIILLLFILLLPIGINLCYCFPVTCDIFKEPMKWTEFWGTYLSALASFAMVIITWITLRQNKEQLNELKRQWNEKNKPIIHLTIEYIEKAFFLKVENIGNETLTKVRIVLGEKALLVIQNEGIDIRNIKSDNVLDDNLNLGINSYRLYPLCLYRDIGRFDYLDIIIEFEKKKELYKLDLILPRYKHNVQ